MLKWCSYCQRLIGEVEPFEDLELSHGICPDCMKARRWSSSFIETIDKLAQFQREVLEKGRMGDLSQAPDLLKKGLELGVRPLDFLVGFIQPNLYKIGSLWEKGDISVAEEHRFTAFSSRLIDLCYQERPETRHSNSRKTDFLLVNAPGNFHFLGLRIIEQWLISRGRAVYTVFPGIPEEEILKLVSELKPKYVGVSIALTQQQGLVSQLSSALTKMKSWAQTTPVLLVGGPALRRKDWQLKEIENVFYCKEVFALNRLLDLENPVMQMKRGAQ